jgi:phage major head subunit gpT-like protein
MIITRGTLATLFVAFKAAFASGLGQAESQWQKIATLVPSTTKSNEYGWLGKFPKMREWVGDRVINGLLQHGYTIRNKSYELTVGVDRDDIEDDNLGIYTPLMTEMGQSAAEKPDELVFGLLSNGHANLCYDGQNFFDTDHPVIAEDGSVGTQANLDDNAGAGTRWYLLDTRRALKPLIFQDRKAANFVSMDSETDENVFMRKEFVYGVDNRCNAGYGFWQQAFCSRKALDEANLVAAYTAMTERKGDHGRPLGIKPSVLVVPPGLKFAAMKLVNATTLANGADNVMKGLVEVIDDPRLA